MMRHARAFTDGVTSLGTLERAATAPMNLDFSLASEWAETMQ
jgi:hypothetical protein